ncbi:BTB/POZ domain-containing protein 9-like [Colletes latitarsis]|uniref:BTB/POZ domain-containing protein 9-like n=1 Tax=Colletes latitarsis TaxID=2605962 RepID=UPI0040365A3C
MQNKSQRKKMSSHHQLNPPSGDIEHIDYLSQNIGALYLSDDYSDVTLIVGDKRLNGHKIILAARSEYFRALLFGGLKESTQHEIELKNANLIAFKALLEYIYTGRTSLTDRRDEVVLDILGLAHLYGFSELETSISDYLRDILSIKNICLIFDAALLYQLKFLTTVCHDYMDKHACEVIQHESFLQLSATALNELISKDSFYAPEIDIFLAVRSWVQANPNVDHKSVLETLPDALSTGCSKCNEKQRITADKVINHLRTKRPNDWERLAARYDPDGQYKSRFEDTQIIKET